MNALNVVFVDVSPPKGNTKLKRLQQRFLTTMWLVGAQLFLWAHKNAHKVLVAEPEDVYAYLDGVVMAGGRIKMAQFFGHARPGSMLVGGRRLSVKRDGWRAVEGGTCWFRGCSTLQGLVGRDYAEHLASRGVDVVGNLCVVGPWAMHSHLVGIRAGATPWWSAKLKPGSSRPWLPRTIPAWQMTLPTWTFTK